jgi:hypothetical protein
VIAFVQGNWRQAGKRYEAAFEHAAMIAARRACDRIGLPFVVKLHPNAVWWHRMRLQRVLGLTLVSDAGCFSERHPVFLNLLSTAYYELLPLGPTFFLADDLIHPLRVFGDHVMDVRLEGLDALLAGLVDPDCWHRLHHAQREAEAQFRTGCVRSGGASA